MRRFYADERGIADGKACLPPEDAVHAARVLRMVPGDECEVFSGGERYLAEAETVSPEEVTLKIVRQLPSTEPKLRITLYQGLPKGDKMELIIQKAVELGAESVVPVAMERSVVKLDRKDAEKKRDRWQKIAREACKQSGRCVEPAVELPISFAEIGKSISRHDCTIVPWEDARNISLTQIRRGHPDITSLGIVIGPEGGISQEEIDRLEASGAIPVTLGPRILRTETAGLCAVSALMCLYGEME